MNDKFKQKLNESGLSVYALSRISGIPYTTVSEIKNCKTSINKCSLYTVYKLAAALCCAPDDITDEILYLDGTEAVYKGICYKWKCDDTSKIRFTNNGQEVTIDFGTLYNIPSRMDAYNLFARWRIQRYLDDLAWKKKNDDRWRQLNDKRLSADA